ncbi:MAG: DNA polymerase III subunit epsilon [Alphaproteobacteria bacterium]|nr:DNA polymerase III subunit epsilon [Alphaproteobacteria bacterium]
MREISLDTETTGLSFKNGDRMIEIGCVEIIDKKITGNSYHVYINPERDVSAESTHITGLTNEFLQDFKPFRDVYKGFLDFIKNDRVVIHNAPFDMSFINGELGLLNYNALNDDTNKKIVNEIVDTLSMARKKYPGSPATLDALCKKFNVDSTIRSKHGALIDAELLAQVYIIMSVEKVQMNLFGNISKVSKASNDNTQKTVDRKLLRNRKPIKLSDEEIEKHRTFIKKLNNPIWNEIIV